MAKKSKVEEKAEEKKEMPPVEDKRQETLPLSEEIPEVAKTGEVTDPPKRRGRPPGSKNGAKSSGGVKVKPPSIPPHLLAELTLLPLKIGNGILARTRGVILEFQPDALAVLPLAMKAYLDSVEVELTPGMALAAAYLGALATATPHILEKPSHLKAVPNAEDGNAASAETPPA